MKGRGGGDVPNGKATVSDQTEQVKELGAVAGDVLLAYLRSDEADKNAVQKAKIAASTFSSVMRFHQAQGAREATVFMMARELARDKEELRRYIEASMPNSPLVKALPVPKEG